MSLRVDQALHGYADGHSLLRSSIRLSSEAERLMLGLSDMSGPGMRAGFDTYLTAYPLLGERVYVIARTWYAPEMQRPGCVWTHSLLIRDAHIRDIGDGGCLLPLFRRPRSPRPDDTYSSPICIGAERAILQENTPAPNPERGMDSSLVRSTLRLLYGQPDRPLYIAAAGPLDCESMVIALWSQQWPELRRTFSFCTGALASRSVHGEPFDLQVIPRQAMPDLRPAILRGSVVDCGSPPVHPQDPATPWLDEAVGDLQAASPGGVRGIAWSLAEGRASARGDFAAVFHLAAAIGDERAGRLGVEGYVQAVAATPGVPKVPASLIRAALEPAEHSGFTSLSEGDLLRALAVVPMESLSHLVDPDLDARAVRFLETDRKGALHVFWELIGSDRPTPLGSQVLLGMCRALRPEDLESVVQRRPSVVTALVQRNPRLAVCPAIWQATQDVQVDVFHALMSSAPDEPTLKEVVGTILLAGSEEIGEQAARYGARLVVAILQWVNESAPSTYRPSRSWTRYLRSHSDTVAAWMAARAPTVAALAILSSTLAADDPSVASLELRLWEPLVQSLVSLDPSERVPVAAFLYAIGLRRCDRLAMRFLCGSFETVHNAAAGGALQYDWWRPIGAAAPPLDPWREWDKCERTTAALVDRFAACGWPGTELMSAIRSTNVLDQVFGLSRTTKERREFLRQTARLALQGDLPPGYRRILERCSSR